MRLRAIAAAVVSALFVFTFGVQSDLICADSGHAVHQHGVPHPHHTGQTADHPICCWTLATCASPAAPAARAVTHVIPVIGRNLTVARMDRPRSIAFAPETPPPKSLA